MFGFVTRLIAYSVVMVAILANIAEDDMYKIAPQVIFGLMNILWMTGPNF